MDSTVFSFKVHPGETECRLPLIMTINSLPTDRDREYELAVDAGQSTAVKDTHYTLPESFTFRKGLQEDTCWITLKKTADLDQEDRRLVLTVKGNGNILPGADMFNTAIIRINNMISQPMWWNRTITRYFLDRKSVV